MNADGSYYADGRHVFRSPIHSTETSGITLGFCVCKIADDVNDEAAQEIADALNLREDKIAADAEEESSDMCPVCFAHASSGGCELEKTGGTCRWVLDKDGIRAPKYIAVHSSEDPAERLAYELSVELEQADLDRNDLVTVNRAKLLAIATRVLAATAKAEAHQ